MIADEPIPVYTTLAEVFGSAQASLPYAARWNNLAEEFLKRFGRKPTYIARAPGRVNLIGEHIDYALFGVLPAAVDRDILVACAPRPLLPSEHRTEAHHEPGAVIVDNLHPKYTRQIFAPASKQPVNIPEEEVHAEAWFLDINTKELRWESYVKAGYYGVLNHHFTGVDELPVPVDLLVTGSVPAGSGLSSSAAMAVASTLAFLAVNDKLDSKETILTKGSLVQLSMENEKRVGVNSGGMDQAASIMSDPSSALQINFYPTLSASAVPLPPRAVFVIANSLVVSDKVSSAKWCYNLRVVETLAAAKILANSLGIVVGPKEKVTLREIVGRWKNEATGEDMGVVALQKALEELLDSNTLDVLKAKDGRIGVTMDEMVQMSGLSKAEFEDVYLSWVEVEATHFQLYNRTKHVFSEAVRVLQFQRTCLDAAASHIDEATSLEGLGRIMNASQESCSKLYECSCPELDQLTRLAREAGAIGSRLTGAGWGGCTVSLVQEDQVETFIRRVKETYGPYKSLEGHALDEVIFATTPGRGACVYKFD